jgi:hypothetical protein
MTKSVYENLAKKVYIFSSILPQGLVKYLDVGQDQNLKEINVVTIATIHVSINKDIIKNFKKNTKYYFRYTKSNISNIWLITLYI